MNKQFEDNFTILFENDIDCDVLSLVDNEKQATLTKIIQKAYNLHMAEKTLSYFIIFQRENKEALMIIEQTFMKHLYHEFNISLSPWVKFKGHVIVPLKEFEESVEQEHIEILLNS